MSRAQLSAQERAFRSRLAQIVHKQPMIRATVCVRNVTCGKTGCRCTKGNKHRAVYLSCSVKGKSRQLFVPQSMEKEVRLWVENYHTVQELLEQLSERAWQTLKAQKERNHS